MKLTIIRGLPGSGKSTMARSLGCDHFEADMYFVQPDGNYLFNRNKLKDAHEWCQMCVRRSLCLKRDVVVSNTFVKQWEMQPYIHMANEFNVELEILTATGSYGNIHGVPDEIVQRMKREFEE